MTGLRSVSEKTGSMAASREISDEERADEVRFVVVIPTYNHGRSVADVARRTMALGVDVIVVNDGSTDDTAAVLDELERSSARGSLEVRAHESNLGKAAALRTGFAIAAARGATHAGTIDADGQLDPRDLPALMAEAGRHPTALIIGRRPDRMDACPTRCALGRRYASLAVLVQTGLRLSDTQCGLRVYPLDRLGKAGCRAAGYAFEAEVITRMAWAGHEVREVPVGCRYFDDADRVSHWRPWHDSLKQAVLHVKLAGLALVPRTRASRSLGDSTRSRVHRLIAWLNPLRSWREVREGRIGDLELASGLAIGAMIGSSPFYGLHTLMSVYVAWRLHQHPAAVVLGSQVSIPPLGVLLAAASMWLGHLILTGDPSHLGSVPLTWESVWQIPVRGFAEWLVGSLLLGPLVAALAFALGLAIARGARRIPQLTGTS